MSLRPGRLLLRTAGSCDLDPEYLVEVFGEQRKRFMAVVQGFGPEDWVAPTRCTAWTAHDVVRHLCDSNSVAAGTNPDILDVGAGYDPRVTPGLRLAGIVSTSPGATLGRLGTTTEELLGLFRGRLAQGRQFEVRLPYGPMDWTVLVLHAFWDSWLHERDVMLARGAEHLTDEDATFYAAAYGVFLAAAVAPLFGDRVQQRLMLGGDGGGVFDVDSSAGVVALRVTREATGGPAAAEVTDALAGRSAGAGALCRLPSNSRAPLSRLADFFNTPVQPSKA